MCTNQIANLEGVKLELWAYEDEATIKGVASNGMSLLQVEEELAKVEEQIEVLQHDEYGIWTTAYDNAMAVAESYMEETGEVMDDRTRDIIGMFADELFPRLASGFFSEREAVFAATAAVNAVLKVRGEEGIGIYESIAISIFEDEYKEQVKNQGRQL